METAVGRGRLVLGLPGPTGTWLWSGIPAPPAPATGSERPAPPGPLQDGRSLGLRLAHVGRDKGVTPGPGRGRPRALGSWSPPQTPGDWPLDVQAPWGPPGAVGAGGPDAEVAPEVPAEPPPTGGDGPAHSPLELVDPGIGAGAPTAGSSDAESGSTCPRSKRVGRGGLCLFPTGYAAGAARAPEVRLGLDPDPRSSGRLRAAGDWLGGRSLLRGHRSHLRAQGTRPGPARPSGPFWDPSPTPRGTTAPGQVPWAPEGMSSSSM